MSNQAYSAYHEDAEFFRVAVAFTEAQTGFNARLIEKDYFCSLLLHGLQGAFARGLVFKGGTSLSKIHCDFYRLSEDLDFAVSVPVDSTRSVRSKAAKPFGKHVESLTTGDAGFTLCRPLRGHNNSTQYTTEIEYQSIIMGQSERIKLEISVREPILETPKSLPCRLLLRDPFRGKTILASIPINALSLRETYAEKLRAAMTRREPAIRDFYDIDYAMQKGLINLEESGFVDLVRRKLSIPGNDAVDMSLDKAEILTRQLHTQLRPVLRENDYTSFDLPGVFSTVTDLAQRL